MFFQNDLQIHISTWHHVSDIYNHLLGIIVIVYLRIVPLCYRISISKEIKNHYPFHITFKMLYYMSLHS